MDPERDLRRYESEVRVADNVASRQRYAEELVRRERYDEAIAQYREALTGLYEHDPNLMLGLAQAQFGKGDASAARATLDELIRHNPDFRSPTGHLLYARALEAEGNVPKALEEYAVLARSEEHTSELQSRLHLVCRLLLEKKKITLTSALSPSSVLRSPITPPAASPLPAIKNTSNVATYLSTSIRTGYVLCQSTRANPPAL